MRQGGERACVKRSGSRPRGGFVELGAPTLERQIGRRSHPDWVAAPLAAILRLRLDLEPQLRAWVEPVPMPFQDEQGRKIYTNPAVEAQLRIGLAWSLGAPWDTPNDELEPVSRTVHP